METRTTTFTGPSGYTYTIREQNGEDENILSNQNDIKNIMHLTKFISAIVVDTDATTSHKLTIDGALNLPALDRYAILVHSRIFSLGNDMVFTYKWPDVSEPTEYTDTISDYIFTDYSQEPTEEELEAKPNAIPYYPDRDFCKEGKVITLSSGKQVSFKALTGVGEQYVINLPVEKQTRNSELIARDLCLSVNGNFEKVTNFSLFNPRDMAEIRKAVSTFDPVFVGLTQIDHPTDPNQKTQIPIFALQSFFFLTEV